MGSFPQCCKNNQIQNPEIKSPGSEIDSNLQQDSKQSSTRNNLKIHQKQPQLQKISNVIQDEDHSLYLIMKNYNNILKYKQDDQSRMSQHELRNYHKSFQNAAYYNQKTEGQYQRKILTKSLSTRQSKQTLLTSQELKGILKNSSSDRYKFQQELPEKRVRFTANTLNFTKKYYFKRMGKLEQLQ